MISEAVTFGTIQVPPDGKPIILMADRQTTGGYPKIASVASVDLLRPGPDGGAAGAALHADHAGRGAAHLPRARTTSTVASGRLLEEQEQ